MVRTQYLSNTDEYDIGYRYLESEWGNGYSTEAAQAVLDHCRPRLKGKRIIGTALVENVASIRVLEKVGMQFEKQ